MDQSNRLQVPQDRETPVRVERDLNFAWRYAYARAAETRAVGDQGQDYLTLCHDERIFSFALCDGVTLSFYGDLAARFLGNALMDWLWNGLPATLDAEAIRLALVAHLHAITTPATELVQNHPLPQDIPIMLQEVLERKRVVGSESTFICGRVDLSDPSFPDGRVILAWLGDSRLRCWGPTGECSKDLSGKFKSEHRWSSREGPVGSEPYLFVSPLNRDGHQFITDLMAYSDGLNFIDEYTNSLSDLDLQNLIAQTEQIPTSDDIAFLEVWLRPVSTDHT